MVPTGVGIASRISSAFRLPPSAISRLALVHLLQLPSVMVLVLSTSPWAVWPAALWGSIIACAGTDSGWRWLNRLLLAEAILWLTLALACTPF